MTALAEAIANSGDPWALCIEQYGRALNAFSREVLGCEPDKWQEDTNRAISQGHTRIAIRSGHGVGKTKMLANLVVWFTCTRLPFKVGMTAPSAPQLHDALLGELRAVYRSLPLAWANLFDVQSDRIELKAQPDNCFVTARTSRADNPESLQGLHSENLLLIIDEASGVPEAVFEAAVGSMSTPRAITVMTGNPTRATGMFWRAFNMEPERWWLRKVSCHESRFVDPAFIEEVLNRWGPDSNQYRVRCLGEFPLAEDDTLIPAGLVESAMERVELPMVGAPEIWGVDVARFGSDQSVLVKRRGNRVIEPPRRWQGVDTMHLSGIIKNEFDLTQPQNRPQLIAIDVIGIGAGVVDRLLEQNLPVLGVNVGEAPPVQGRFMRLRDQLWLSVREWLETRAVSLPFDDQLRADLCAPRVTFLSDGRMLVESKQQLRARGFRSPDCFVTGTMVMTPAGDRPIEELLVGDDVVTPFGVTRIVAAWGEYADSLTTVTFSNGRVLHGTGHHKVFCWGAGIKRLDALCVTDAMEPLTNGRLRAWRALHSLSIGGKSSGFRVLVDIISRAGKTSPSAFCIVVFGQTITVLSRTVSMFIMRMMTGTTMRSAISNYSEALSTNGSICANDSPSLARSNAMQNIWKRRASLLPSGTALPRALRSIASWVAPPGRTESPKTYSVSDAVPPSRRTGMKSLFSAPVLAEARCNINAGLQTLGRALGAARHLRRIASAKRSVVPVSVRTESVAPSVVYNLTLEHDNAYYANGILVFNSADALCCTFVPSGMALQLGLGNLLNTRVPIRAPMRAME